MTSGEPAQPPRTTAREVLVLVVILAIAAWLRYFRLGSLPDGLYPDEAANGLDIFRMFEQHDLRVLYNTNGPREALFFYLQAPFVRLMGPTTLALRMAPAAVGVLTVLALFPLARAAWGSRAALIGCFLLAVSSWHVTVSRDAWRVVLLPLLCTLTVGYYLRAVLFRRTRDFLLGGLCFGLGFYTYLPYRLFPLLGVVMGALLLFRYRGAARPFIRPVGRSLGVAVVVLLPMAFHFLHHPADFSARVSSVSVLAQGMSAYATFVEILRNVVRTTLMFHVRGDLNFRHGIAFSPHLDPLAGALLLAGMVGAAVRYREPLSQLLLAWVAIMCLPAILTIDFIPHALRTLGALPAVYLLAGIGGDRAWSWLEQRWPALRRAIALEAGALAALALAGCYHRYFRVWASAPPSAAAYGRDLSDIAAFHLHLPAGIASYSVMDHHSEITIEYLTWRGKHLVTVEPQALSRLELVPGRNIFTFSTQLRAELDQFAKGHPGGTRTVHAPHEDGEPSFYVYELVTQ